MKQLNFNWSAKNRVGQKLKGQAKEYNAELLKLSLSHQGLVSIKIRRNLRLLNPKIKYKEVTYFTRQLAIMLKAGLSLSKALDVMLSANGPLQTMLIRLKKDIEQGKTVAESLQKFPKQFDALFCNMVKIGEVAGILERVLLSLAEYREKVQSLQSALFKALSYPVMVLIIAFIITLGLLIFIVPQFQNLFAQFNAPLPAFTQLVIDLSQGLKNRAGILLLLGIGMVLGFMLLKRQSESFRRQLDTMLLNLPVVGKCIQMAIIIRMARTLSLMLLAGLPLTQSLQLLSEACANRHYKIAMTKCGRFIKNGQAFYKALQESGPFPLLFIQMIQVGEESGTLEAMLDKAAELYQDELDNKVAILKELLEPVMMTILGLIVGGLVIAMYLPVFNLGGVM
ncbi:MAG: type II secretion system F family protein [Gammaproteobacteria bacterium]|nr:type II secretion system F family protein [Gammaproteobacteria bacterium]